MEISTRSASDVIDGVVDEGHRQTMTELDRRIRAAMPGRAVDVWQGVFWGGTDQTIVGYGRLLQPRPKGDDVRWFLIGLAAQERHVSVYVNAVIHGQYVLRQFDGRLGKVTVGSASIAVRRLTDLDLETLDSLVATCDEGTPRDAW